MTYELTNQEKISVVNQHLKTLEYSAFNLSLSVIEEEAATIPNAENISNLNLQIAEVNAKKTALLAELEELGA